MNKKALSLLLAVSMVFSLNTVVFAEEATDVAVATEEVAVESIDEVVDTQSINGKDVNEQSSNTKDGVYSEVSYNSTVYFTGKKVTAADLGIEKVFVSGNGVSGNYTVKKIKSKNKKVSTSATFYITSIDMSGVTGTDKKNLKKDLKVLKKVAWTYEIAKLSVSDDSAVKIVAGSKSNKELKSEVLSSTLSENYVLSVRLNSKGTKVKGVYLAYKTKSNKAAVAKINKDNYDYNSSTNVLSFKNSVDGTLVVSGNSAAATVSSN